MMDAVPLLAPEQTEELKAMVLGILEDNKKCIDDALAEQVHVESTSILKLYEMVTQEWAKKQKIVDNLCHFSLTMMATVDLLWQQKHQQDQRIANAETLVEQLQHHIELLGEENERCKHKINEAETHIQSISGEKDKFEELYRSQSCCNFEETFFSAVKAQPRECCEHRSLLQQRQQIVKESGRSLLQKESEISLLRQEKLDLQRRLQELTEQHQLVKLEIQLAEIAVKDALSYKESSFCSRSMISRNDEVYMTKSHAQFMNGELECFSNLDDSFNLEKKSLAHEFDEGIVHFVSNPELPLEDKKNQIDGANPFKKKVSRNDDRRCNTEANQKDSCLQLQSQLRQAQTKLTKGKKTVSLQCNLLKNVPKIRMFPRKATPEPQKQQPVSLIKPPLSSMKHPKKSTMSQSAKLLSQSEIMSPQSSGSLSRFFNFIASRIITSRIKLK